MPGDELAPFPSAGYELIIIRLHHYTYTQAVRVHIKDSNGLSFVVRSLVFLSHQERNIFILLVCLQSANNKKRGDAS